MKMRTNRTWAGFSLVLTVLVLLSAAAVATASPFLDDEATVSVVLTGPCGMPGASGPTGINDDFTNLSVTRGIAGVPPGGLTTAAGSAVFRNMVENLGATDDTFVITAPSSPESFKIEISTDDGANYVLLDTKDRGVNLPAAYRAAAIFFVRITAPAGLTVLTGFDTVIRATSTLVPNASNDTIDRLYTGFVRLEKTTTVINATGVGGPAEPVPGAEIEFTITYSNISTKGGAGNSLLTARDILIYENGNQSPNNWGSTTEHIVGASDTQGGITNGDRPDSTSVSDLISRLPAGESGVFKFKRRIKQATTLLGNNRSK